MIKIYTDGSCRKNGSQNAAGAWGFAIVENNDTIVCKVAHGVKDTTNQRMELQAAAEACDAALEKYGSFADIQIISDSAYLINCVNQHWYEKWEMNGWTTSGKTAVVNKDLWERLIPYFRSANFTFCKTKGHAGDKYNNIVDEMVQSLTETMV